MKNTLLAVVETAVNRKRWRLYSMAVGLLMGLCMALPTAAQDSSDSSRQAIQSVLNEFHDAAAAGDWDRYFGLMTANAVFIGTDVSERWPRDEFQRYASGRSGWTYYPGERHIDLSPDGNTAWFDEILDSVSYGTSRGTGVLVNTSAGWKIAQYHLTFPVPNALAGDITDQIKAYEAQGN